MLTLTGLDPRSGLPLYREIFYQLRVMIDSGRLEAGAKLPPTRELAGQLGLNRATVSAAYELLEADGLITGHVGRGSFVASSAGSRNFASPGQISFANSRPSEMLFPVEEFRGACAEMIRGSEVQDVLQLGSPAGYGPLRRYLLQHAREEGVARDGDDILITSGCQQAFDLLQRSFVVDGQTVLIEDPVYPGLKNVFERAGSHVMGIPIAPSGLDCAKLRRVRADRPPPIVVGTSNFQKPTGNTPSLAARQELLRIVPRPRAPLIAKQIFRARGS